MSDEKKVLGRIKCNLKSKEAMTFTDFKGEQRTDRYRPVFTIWANKFGGGDVAFERNLTVSELVDIVKGLFAKTHYLSYFPVKNDGAARQEDF